MMGALESINTVNILGGNVGIAVYMDAGQRYFGLLPSEVENARGVLVVVEFKDSFNLRSVEGRLYNIDPTTGSVTLFLDDTKIRIIPNHSVLKLTCKSSITFALDPF